MSTQRGSPKEARGREHATVDRRVVAYVAVVAVAAALLMGSLLLLEPPTARVAHPLLFGLLATAVLTLSEIPFARLSFLRHGTTFSLGEAVLCVVFGLFSPGAVVVITAVAVTLAHCRMTASAIKRVFNAAQYVLSVGTGSSVAWILGHAQPIGSLSHLAAVLLGLFVWFVANTALVATVISLASHQSWRKSVIDPIPVNLLSLAGLAPVGALALVLVARAPQWLPLLTAPIVVLFIAMRGFVHGNRRAETTDALLALGDDLNRTLDLDARALVVADGVRSMLQAEWAELLLLSDTEVTRTRVQVDGPPVVLEPVALDPSPNPYAHVLATGESQLYQSWRADSPLMTGLAARGIQDMVAAPTVVEGRVNGVLVAANRLGPENFGPEHVKILQGIAQLAVGPLVSAQVYAAERASAERLRELDRMKSDFVASVSHELRTPLTLIHGFALTLAGRGDRLTPEERAEFLDKIVLGSRQLARLIEDLLAVSRWEHVNREDDAAVEVAAVVADVIEQLGEVLADHNVMVDTKADLPPLRAAPQRVELVLRNLVENAAKYSPAHSPILVRAGLAEGGVAIEVADRGPGIPADQHARIFERFYQLDQSSTRRVGGTGLGLYLVKNLTEAIGGTVELESEPGRGSVFRVVLPVRGEVIPFPHRQEEAR